MSSCSIFIADVHLQADSNHPINTAFRNFLKKHLSSANNLYILGDLFDTWMGDDIDLTTYAREIKSIRKLVDNGTKVWIMFGNRDLLMRKRFWEITGATFLKQPICVNINQQNIILLHGDTLCTDDKKYQLARFLLNNKIATWFFLRVPINIRRKIVTKIRQNSKKHTKTKPKHTMDVTTNAVTKLFLKYPTAKHMIHGHTHLAFCHTYNINNTHKYRWVLGDWKPNMYYIKFEKHKSPELIYL